MTAKPVGQRGFADLAHGHSHHRRHRILPVASETAAIVGQKQAGHDPGRAFVAIRKAMAPGQAKGVSGGQISGVNILISGAILRARQSRLDGAAIANAVKPPMLGQLTIMKRKDQIRTDPAPVRHFASARRISRSSCMIASAKAI